MNKVIILILLIWMMSSCENGKKYPIRIQQVWGNGTYIYSETFDVDSIRGETLWKDGNPIKSNNIKNIKFN